MPAMPAPAAASGTLRVQLSSFMRAQSRINTLLTRTFPAPLLAPALGLSLRSTLAHLADLILRLQCESGNPASLVLRPDGRHAAAMLLAVVGVGMIEALDEVESLVRIQATAGDGSDLRWWNWVASLKMVGLDRDGDGGGLVGARTKLSEVAWRLEWLFRVLAKPNMDQILPRLSHIRETFNSVVLNHQWLYFPSSSSSDESGNDDADSIKTTTPSLYSNLRSRFGPQQQKVVSDGESEYSVNTFTTTTTTRDRMSRNKGALDMDSMVVKFQEAAAGNIKSEAGTGTGGLPEASAFLWRTKADQALLMLMHWVYEARLGLLPFLDYHITYAGPNASPGQLAQEPLPVQGYVNLIKAAWMLQIIDPAKAPLSNDLGPEGRALIGLLTCEVINLFQVIHEHEFDLPSAEATLAQGNFTVIVEGLPERQRTPTRTSMSTPFLGATFEEELARSGVGAALPSVVLSLDRKHESSGSSSSAGSANAAAQLAVAEKPRGRPRSAIAPETIPVADLSSTHGIPVPGRSVGSSERGSSVGSKLEGRGRTRGHWRSFSSSFSSDRDRQPAQQPTGGNTVPAAPPPEKSLSSIYHRRPSTSASTSSTPAAGSHQNAFARVFSPFSSSLPSSKSTRQRSRSPSPLPPSRDPAQSHRASQSSTVNQYTPATSTHEPPIPPSPSSTRGYIFPKLPFPSSRERERNRSGLITGSLVSLTGSIVEALGDKTKGVYATKPLPSLQPLPLQAPPPPPQLPRVVSTTYGESGSQRDREGKYFGGSRNISGFRWNERESVGTLGGARDGETEIMPKHLDEILFQTSYTGELHSGRWDDCRVKIYARQAPGPNGAFGTNIRIVTVNLSMEGSVDQRNLFVENTELVPEYAYHENWPVVYLRMITNTKRRERKNSTRHIKSIAPTASNQSVTTFQQPGVGWDECSLYYRFSTLREMFTYQQALLGEIVETDIRHVPTIRYKRNLLDGEHTHYRARLQLWRESSDKSYSTVHQYHMQHNPSAQSSAANNSIIHPVSPTSPTGTNIGRALGNPQSTPLLKVHNSRLVIYWEGGGGIMIFLTDSIDVETRSSCAPSANALLPGISSGIGSVHRDSMVNLANRPTSPTTSQYSSITSHDTPAVGTHVLRIKPSTHFAKPFKNPSSIKAHPLSPPPVASQSSGIRLDKQGLTMEDEENSSGHGDAAGGWEEYRWFEIEFQTEKEMSIFVEDFKRLILDRRRERKRREDIVKVVSKNGVVGSVAAVGAGMGQAGGGHGGRAVPGAGK